MPDAHPRKQVRTLGSVAAAMALLSACATPRAGPPRLHQASQSGDRAAVAAVLGGGTPVDELDEGRATALWHAARVGASETVGLLLERGADPDRVPLNGTPPLVAAAEVGSRTCVQRLARAGARLDAVREDGLSALAVATAHGDRLLFDALLELGASPKGQLAGADPPLVLAASTPDPYFAERLIAAGADVNQVGRRGYTPLLVALRDGRWELADRLLAKGARAGEVSEGGTTALLLAAFREDHPPALVRRLLVAGAAPSRGSPGGVTPLMAAASAGRADTVRQLLDAGAAPDAPDAEGRTALHYAAAAPPGREAGVAELLIDRGAGVQRAASGGVTPLEAACRARRADLVVLLVSRGGSADFEDDTLTGSDAGAYAWMAVASRRMSAGDRVGAREAYARAHGHVEALAKHYTEEGSRYLTEVYAERIVEDLRAATGMGRLQGQLDAMQGIERGESARMRENAARVLDSGERAVRCQRVALLLARVETCLGAERRPGEATTCAEVPPGALDGRLLPLPAGAGVAVKTPFVLPQVDTRDFDCLASHHVAVFRAPREGGGMDVTFHGGGDAELRGDPARAAGRRVASHLAFNGVITIRSCPGAARSSEIVVEGEKLVFAVEEGGKLAYVGGRGSVTAAGVVTQLHGNPPIRLGVLTGDPEPAVLASMGAMVEDAAPLGEVETALGFRPGATRHDEFMEKVESGTCQSRPAAASSYFRNVALIDVRRYRGVACKGLAPMNLSFLNGVLVDWERSSGEPSGEAGSWGAAREAWEAVLAPILDDERVKAAFRPGRGDGGHLQLQGEDEQVTYLVVGSGRGLRVSLSFDTSDARARAAFEALVARKRELTRAYGLPLRSLYRRAEIRYSFSEKPQLVDRGVVFVDLDVSPDSPEDRAAICGWVIDCLLNLRRAARASAR